MDGRDKPSHDDEGYSSPANMRIAGRFVANSALSTERRLRSLLPVRPELFEKCDHVFPLLRVLQTGKDHLGVRHRRLRRSQILVEFLLWII